MKKLSAILAVVAVVAIVFAVVFGTQKGNLQTNLDSVNQKLAETESAAKTAADQAATKLAEVEAAAQTAADEAAAKLAETEAAAQTAADEAAAKLAEVEAAAKTAADEAAAKLAETEAAAKTAADEAAAKLAETETAAKTAADEAAAKLAETETAAKTAADEAAANLAELTNVREQYGILKEIASPAFAEYYKGKTVILHSNDVHGAVEGYAYMAGLKNKFEALGANVITVDAGDFAQGSIYVSTSKGETAIDMMNEVGYDIITLGNHEFDFGYAQLKSNLEKANFKVVCANVLSADTHEPVWDATHIIEKDGVKIGFFGLETPETATKVNPGLIREIEFTTFDSLYTCAQAAIDELADADIVIGITHLGVDEESKLNGYRSIDLLNKVTGVDMLIDGHSHTVMTNGENGEPITSTGTKFAYIGVIVIDNEQKAIVDNYLLKTDMLEKDEAVDAKVKELIEKVDAEYGTVFAQSEVNLNGDRAPGNRTEETNLGDLITDAMVWSVVNAGSIAEDQLMQVVGITNGGGIRAAIPAGDVSMKDVNTVLPFGNTVAVIYVKGSDLLEAMEASTFSTPNSIGGYPQTSGIVWTLDTTKEFDKGDVYLNQDGKETTYFAPASINRVTIESVNGQPFDPEATYVVVTNNFCAAGGDTYNVFMKAYNDTEHAGFDTGIPLDEALIDYIKTELNGTIGEKYAEPRGTETQIREEAADNAA